MKIISLTLDNYRGFRLRQIKHFVYRPTQKTQVVLGTNGSGKSSLLRELSPLPANATDFEKKGRKEIEIEHLGKHYLLQSIFDENGSRFPFIVNGENLNPGYTVTVYKELVKAHFNYTPDIHALLTGRVTFHGMSVNDRRNLFTRISPADYTYAIAYHNKLKTNIRDLQGALTRNQKRLSAEVEKCLTTKDEALLRVTVAELNAVLDQLLEHRKPRLTGAREKEAEAEQADEALRRDIARLEAIISEQWDVLSLIDPEALERAQISLKADIQLRQSDIVRRCEVIEGLQKELDAATAVSQTSLGEVETTLRHLREESDTVYGCIRLPLHFDDPAAALSAFEAVSSSLEDILVQLSELPSPSYERDNYQYLLEQAPILNQRVLKLKGQDTELFAQIKALEANRDKHITECPNCHHQWYVGYDEGQYKKLISFRTQCLLEVEQATKIEAQNTEAVAIHRLYFELMSRYVQLTRSFTILQPFWDYLKSTGKLLTAPAELQVTMSTFSTDLKYHLRRSTLQAQINDQVKLEVLMRNTGQVDIGKLKAAIEAETTLITKFQTENRALETELALVKSQSVTLSLVAKLRASIEESVSQRKTRYRLLIEDQCVGVLDELIRSLKITINQHERTLSQVDIQKAMVQTIGVEIKAIDAELVLLKRAQKALSPTEGLIARGMMTFINHFVASLNEFIAKVWSYPLEILPLAMEDDAVDLDYRFKVLVNDDLPTPDVAMTSAGMMEIIDLAFVAVSMQYLGLSNFPFFLDEFAKTFDVAHRQAAYRAIDVLIESSNYSQVFLVSHYQAGYSSLTASEVLVLCDSNVELPSHLVYNKHVTLH